MKNNTLLLIGLGVGAYFLLRKNKPGILGDNCQSTHGPKLDYVDKDGKCVLKKVNKRWSDTIELLDNSPKSQVDCPPNTKYRSIMTSQWPNGGSWGKCYPITEETIRPKPEPKSQADCPAGTNFEGGVCPSCAGPNSNCPPCSPNSCQSECSQFKVKEPIIYNVPSLVNRKAFDCRWPINASECPYGTNFEPEWLGGPKPHPVHGTQFALYSPPKPGFCYAPSGSHLRGDKIVLGIGVKEALGI